MPAIFDKKIFSLANIQFYAHYSYNADTQTSRDITMKFLDIFSAAILLFQWKHFPFSVKTKMIPAKTHISFIEAARRFQWKRQIF